MLVWNEGSVCGATVSQFNIISMHGAMEERAKVVLIHVHHYRWPKGSSVTLCDTGTSAGAPTGSRGYVVDGRL